MRCASVVQIAYPASTIPFVGPILVKNVHVILTHRSVYGSRKGWSGINIGPLKFFLTCTLTFFLYFANFKQVFYKQF